MSNPSPAEVRAFILSKVSGSMSALDVPAEEVADDFDLLGEGIIDSLGLVQLIAAVETRFDARLDFEELEVEDLGVVGPFSRYVADHAAPVRNDDVGGGR